MNFQFGPRSGQWSPQAANGRVYLPNTAEHTLLPERTLHQAAELAHRRAVGRPAVQEIAALAFDSHERTIFAGARAVAMRSRRLLFQSGPTSLDLEVTGLAGRRELQVSGQVVCRTGEQPLEVRFEQPSRQYILSVDRRGEFELDAIKAGPYALAIDFGPWIMAVPSVTL